MSAVDAIPLLAAAGGDYQISRSVRLRSSASAYFNRTPSSNGSTRPWTYSAWVKRGTLGTSQVILDGSVYAVYYSTLGINASNQIEFFSGDGAGADIHLVTAAVFRDPSAWYHIVCSYDASLATAADRFKVYVNGVRQTITVVNGYPTLNEGTYINYTVQQNIGRRTSVGDQQFDGYLTEINFIDNQSLTPSGFGETDAVTGVWKPKKYAGTYGTNGFYLNFADNSAATAAAIGKDSSGNGNNWTPNNISVTAGPTYDSMIDTPTPYADGGNGRGNYAVLNPLDVSSAASGRTMSNGNLSVSMSASWNGGATMGVTSGKFYCEYVLSANIDTYIGIANDFATVATAYRKDGTRYNGSSFVAYGATYTTGDVIGMAFDATNSTIEYFKNGTSQGQITGVSYGSLLRPFFYGLTSAAFDVNFGQRPFTYTPPTGFKALNTQNLPDATIKKGNQYFDATTYTGNGSTQSIVNAGAFQPDFVWMKSRSAATGHLLQDAVRGASKYLQSNSTNAEGTAANVLTSFNSDGFSIGNDTGINTNAATYAAWQWKESASAGFDIVTYTGTGANRTVAHSLGVAPKLIIVKSRSSAVSWIVQHASLGATQYLLLDSTAAAAASSSPWNNTAPTSSVFSLGTSANVNTNAATYVAYLFAEVAGFSKFGSYTGNGSADGPFVYLGFRPRFVMIKETGASGNWNLIDTERSTYNVADKVLLANASGAEIVTAGGAEPIDILSNGFKLKYGGSGDTNTSGGTYIYAAFSENPFKNSLAR